LPTAVPDLPTAAPDLLKFRAELSENREIGMRVLFAAAKKEKNLGNQGLSALTEYLL
jgi:hypothetical protein